MRRSSSLVRTKSFSVVASIRNSIHICHCCIMEFFSELAGPKRHQCLVILKREGPNSKRRPNVGPKIKFKHNTDLSIPRAVVTKEHRGLLPPLAPDKKRTIVLDLDETLVHSMTDPRPPNYDFIVTPFLNGVTMNFYVLKRPGVDEFLEAISKKYEVVVFTAGLEPYASSLLDLLDPKGLISHRLYRDSCNQPEERKFTKDLSKIGRELGKVVIVDDNPRSYALQPENGIPIKKFVDDFEDRELEKLLGFFERNCDGFEDMRDAVKEYFGGAPTIPTPGTFD
ncbi:hypothetical protein V6N11_032537 [Hibiscus sabdariffa]|uniref:FCP1 homology domain-containing protein n=1 Tax=Hibiscus sabdariffa TaxID=183260 RepID=A0ABR2T0Z2_9ROSI